MKDNKVRLDRVLSYLGFAKREEIKMLIKEEGVLVNNRVVKSNAYIKDKDIVTVNYNDMIIVFEVNLEFKDNKILLGVTVIKKESVKYYSC